MKVEAGQCFDLPHAHELLGFFASLRVVGVVGGDSLEGAIEVVFPADDDLEEGIRDSHT